MADFQFTTLSQAAISSAIQVRPPHCSLRPAPRSDLSTSADTPGLPRCWQVAKSYNSSQVYPVHLALTLLSDPNQSPNANGSTDGSPAGQQSLLWQVINQVGGDPVAFQRALQKAIVKLPAQDPPPEDVSIGPLSKLLRDGQELMKTQVRLRQASTDMTDENGELIA